MSEIHELREKLAAAKAKERTWRDAFHALRLTIDERIRNVEDTTADLQDDLADLQDELGEGK